MVVSIESLFINEEIFDKNPGKRENFFRKINSGLLKASKT